MADGTRGRPRTDGTDATGVTGVTGATEANGAPGDARVALADEARESGTGDQEASRAPSTAGGRNEQAVPAPKPPWRTPAPAPAPASAPTAAAARASSPTRRGLLAASAVAGLGVLAGCGTSTRTGPGDGKARAGGGKGSARHSPSPSPRRTRPRMRPQLPRGGRELFPHYRLVGYCGIPGAPALGRLGSGDPGEQVSAMEKKAREYAGGREPLPVLELLATIANPTAGPDGTYRTRTPDRTIRRFHELAREREALLLLNIQPGRADALDEVKALSEWLEHPDVGVALDPEWDMGPGEVPGQTFGHTSGGELNSVAEYLAKLVDEHDLPHKPFVYHQVATSVVSDERELRPPDGVTLIKSADGIGSPGLKKGTWGRLVEDLPEGLHTGFKLFYEEDAESSRLMKPDEVLKLRPEPEYVMYE